MISEFLIRSTVEIALSEDLGPGDLTTSLVVPSGQSGRAVIIAKDEGIIAGLPVAAVVFRRLDPSVEVHAHLRDGEKIRPGLDVASLRGPTHAILSGERVALNFLQRMSGIATMTAWFVQAVAGTKCRIADTRKTAPGLRLLDKYAVMVGGGVNHRFGLFDGVLIKENHVKATGGIREAVRHARRRRPHMVRIEVEVRTLKEVEEALDAGADVILLDNMSVDEIRQAVDRIGGRALVEVSGGITLENVRAIAEAGVDIISIGALTHSPKALDLSLELLEAW